MFEDGCGGRNKGYLLEENTKDDLKRERKDASLFLFLEKIFKGLVPRGDFAEVRA